MELLCSLCGHSSLGPVRKQLFSRIMHKGHLVSSLRLNNKTIQSIGGQTLRQYKAHSIRGGIYTGLNHLQLQTSSQLVKNCHCGIVAGNNLSQADIKKIKSEQKAFRKLLFQSLLSHIGSPVTASLISGKRLFSTTNSRKQQQQQGNQQQQSDEEEDKDKDGKDDDKNQKVPLAAWVAMGTWMGIMMYVVTRLQSGDDLAGVHFVSWNSFVYDILAKGEVAEISVHPESETAFIQLHPGAVIKGQPAHKERYALKIVEPYKFEDKIRRLENELGIKSGRGIPISYYRENSWSKLVLTLIIGCAIFLFLRNNVKIQMPDASDMFASERKAKFVRVDQQKGKVISFKDVAGLHEAKIEVMELVDYLKSPDRYKLLGAKVPKGALLLGPPGCGKTLLAKALASESKVPFLAMAGSDFVEIVGGLGAARVRDLFKEAKQKKPCVIYLDEIDAIGRQRGGAGSMGGEQGGEGEHTLNQLLVEMDGMNTTEGVIILASTNRPDILDKALLRPGRFDRHITIDLPTLQERREIFLMYLQKLKLAKAANTYVERLAQLSPGMSGADIANICNEAALHAARIVHNKIDSDDFEYAVERVVAGVAKKSRVLSPQEKKIVAYHEAGHAIVGWMLKETDALLRVSIVPRTSNMLGFAQYMPADRKLHSKEELFERMCMMLGGRVAESLTFNAVTSGAQDDLKKVTKMAYTQIRQLGFNERVGNVSFPINEDQSFGSTPYSKKLKRIIDEEARIMIAKAYQETEKLLNQHKEKLRMLAEELLEKETLMYDDIEQLIGPPPYSMKQSSTPTWA